MPSAPGSRRLALALLVLLVLWGLPAWSADPIARIAYLRGAGTAQAPGEPARALAVDLPLYVNDRLSTAADSAVRIVFGDRTDAWIGADTVFIVHRYSADRDDPGFVGSVLKGTFRILTGLIARTRPHAVRVNIHPASTIGIRGTHFGGEVREHSASIVLLEHEDGEQRNGIEVSNAFGAVVIDEAGFGTDIPDEFSAPSPPRRMQLRSIDNLMRTMQSIQRIQVPRLPR